MLTLRKHKYIKRWRGRDGKFRYQYPSESSGSRGKKKEEESGEKAQYYNPVKDWKENGVKSRVFKSWFGDWENNPEQASKVVDKSGKPEEQYNTVPAKVYHGTADKSFRKFDPEIFEDPDALLYGKGVYFTEDKEIAKEYMEKGKTAERMYGLNKQLTAKDYDRLSDTISELPASIRNYISRENFQESIVNLLSTPGADKMEPIKDLKEKLGVELQQTATPGIFEVFLNIRKPFDVDNDSIPVEKIPKAKENYEKRKGGAKGVKLSYRQILNYVNPENRKKKGMAGKKGKSELNEALQSMGYDGMTHIGGWNMGTKEHRVWIAFESTQIKSTNNKGTFSEEEGDIMKSLDLSEDDYNREQFREHLRRKGTYVEKRDAGKFVDPRQLKMGIRVEYEHTDDPEIARQIALDHLMEDPEYYTKLGKFVETHKSLLFKAKYIKRWRGKDGKWKYQYPKEGSEKGSSEHDAPEDKSEYQLNQALNMPYTGIAVADGLEEHGIKTHDDLKEAIKSGTKDTASKIFRSVVDKVKATGLPKATVNQTIDAVGQSILQLKRMYSRPKHKLTTKVTSKTGKTYYTKKTTAEEDPLKGDDPPVSAKKLQTAKKRLGGWDEMSRMPSTAQVKKMIDQGTAELKKGKVNSSRKWYVKGRQKERSNNVWVPFKESEKGIKVNLNQRRKANKNYRTSALVEATVPWPYARSFVKHHIESDEIKREILGQMERSKGYRKYFGYDKKKRGSQ